MKLQIVTKDRKFCSEETEVTGKNVTFITLKQFQC